MLKDVGRTLREARETLGISQRELAERAGVARHTVIEAERGEQPIKSSNLDAIARAAEVELVVVFGEKPVGKKTRGRPRSTQTKGASRRR